MTHMPVIEIESTYQLLQISRQYSFFIGDFDELRDCIFYNRSEYQRIQKNSIRENYTL